MSEPIGVPMPDGSMPPAVPAAGETPPSDLPELSGPVDLASLLARQMPLDPFEAIAIVQALCVEVVARGPEGSPRVPDVREIAIAADGGIELHGGGPAEESPVSRVSSLLRALLADAQSFPGALQALARDEMATAACSTSLPEFSARLERFERPGRSAIIRGVYERFQSWPSPPNEQREEGAPSPEAPPAPQPSPWRSWLTSKPARAVAVIAALVFVITTALLFLWPRPQRQGGGAGANAGPGGGAVTSGASQSADHAGPTPGVVNPARRSSRRGATTAARPAAPSPAPEATSTPAPPPVDTAVHTADEAEVVAPELLRSHLPKEPPAGVRPEDVPEVEILVSARGDVESVKLVSPSGGVPASMMLSAIKNWRFKPATKDGQPVRYRLRLRLTNK